MIKRNKTLSIIRDWVEPDEAQATEIVLENAVLQHDALLHIGTCTSDVLTLGKRSLLKFYDLNKLHDANIYVHRRPYGGSGTIYGPRDVLFSLYINKQSFIDKYNVDAAHAHRFFNWCLCTAINKLGVPAYLDESESIRKEDGVCAHLQGRSEIRADKGQTRMVASVFREDELGFYVRVVVLGLTPSSSYCLTSMLVVVTSPLTSVVLLMTT